MFTKFDIIIIKRMLEFDNYQYFFHIVYMDFIHSCLYVPGHGIIIFGGLTYEVPFSKDASLENSKQ